MDIYDSLFSSNHVLNEQIARELFAIMPEQGVFAAIADDRGNFWPSDEGKFRQILSDRASLDHMFSRVDDGQEPVIGQIMDFGVAVSQLATERLHCGYLVLAFEKSTYQSTLANINLIEMLVNQVTLIAQLIDKNNQLHHGELKRLSLGAANC